MNKIQQNHKSTNILINNVFDIPITNEFFLDYTGL